MSSFWVISETGERYGPADLPTLQQWVNEGRVSATTRVSREADPGWFPATEVTGLSFPAISYQSALSPNTPIELSHRLSAFPVWAVVLLTIFVPLFTTIWFGLMHDQMPRRRV